MAPVGAVLGLMEVTEALSSDGFSHVVGQNGASRGP